MDCVEPPKPRGGGGSGGGGGRACFNCLLPGHNARDCPEPQVDRCRNCDAVGHVSRECPKPKDWSRVKCKKCFQYGHGEKRCNEPAGGSGDNGGYANQGGADGGWGSVPDDGGVANLDDWDEGPIEVEW